MPLPQPMTGEQFDRIRAAARRAVAVAAETPAGIANTLGQAGVPVAAARVLADIIVTLRSCVDQQAEMIHELQGRVNALDTAPVHMRGKTEKRNNVG